MDDKYSRTCPNGCGKVVSADPAKPRDLQTLEARMKTHLRFCPKNPESGATRAAVAARLVGSRGQELAADATARKRGADGAAIETPPVVARVDVAGQRAALKNAKSKAKTAPVAPLSPPPAPTTPPVAPPTIVTPPAPAVAPVAPVAPPFKSKPEILPNEWAELAASLHDAESALAVGLAKTENAAMTEAHRRAMSNVLGKLLQVVWQDMTVAQSVKILALLYATLQVAYIGQAMKAGKDAKAAAREVARERDEATPKGEQ